MSHETTIGFLDGLLSVPRGARLVYLQHPRLLRWCIPPMLLAALLILGGFILFGWAVGPMMEWIWPRPEAEAALWLRALWQTASLVAWAVCALLTVVLTLVTFALLTAPFQDLLSEQVEGILGSWSSPPFSVARLMKDLGHSVALAAARIGVKLAWLIPTFLLSLLIPVVGPALYLVLGGYLLAHSTGMDHIDWCGARRGWSWRERLAFGRLHRWALAGLGTAVLATLLIPFAFVLAWPAAVAGGTLLFVQMERPAPGGNGTGRPDAE